MLIGIDIDDVLADFVNPLYRFHNDRYGTSLTRESFTSYRMSNVWGGTGEEAVRKVHEFFQSDYFADIVPVDGSVKSVYELANKGYELISITSRPRSLVEVTREWIERYFPDAFGDRIYFSHNTYVKSEIGGDPGNLKKKSDYCIDFNVTFLIEDSLEYARECSEVGTRVYLLDQPWNRADEPEGIIRVKSWHELMEYFK